MNSSNKPSQKRKNFLIILVVLLCVCILLAVGCVISVFFSPEEPPPLTPQQFPESEIVFATDKGLGFVNSDGKDLVVYPFMPVAHNDFTTHMWGFPLITADGKYLIFIDDGVSLSSGDIYVAPAGKPSILCRQWETGRVRFAADQQQLILDPSSTGQWLSQFYPEDCGTENPPVLVYDGIKGALSPDAKNSARVVMSDGISYDYHDVVIHQLSTGHERTVGPGNSPAWSKDSQWLAYTGSDGIYIVNVAETSAPVRIVSLHNPDQSIPDKPLYDPNHATGWVYTPPIVSWSPDGQWLVYHMLRGNLGETAGYYTKNYSIYKVNVSTGQVIKLLDGGVTPAWRWPVGNP